MFRLTQMLQAVNGSPGKRFLKKPKGPVVIWNLIRRCNLCCKHCYSISADTDFPGELNTSQVFSVMDDLKEFQVPAIILSGGEPLMRPDIYEIGRYAKQKGFYVGLSTNGTLIDESHIPKIKQTEFDYVGISIDGIGKTHDEFRQKEGAFSASMRAIELCHKNDIKVGLRFTITQDNADELPKLIDLCDEMDISKFYLSHLNYAGRGNRNRRDDVVHKITRWALDLLIEKSLSEIEEEKKSGKPTREYVTGNNDADGVYLLFYLQKHAPHLVDEAQRILRRWGGNSSGMNVANIDNLGSVHPDTFWWDYHLGNVKDKPFSEIWQDTSDPLMAGLKSSKRPLKGRCGVCPHSDICGGNTRVRAYQLTGDPWQEDPACYLTDDELGIKTEGQRVELKPYSRQRMSG